MRRRAYVLIFFSWALITIITPTLIQWSAAAAAAAKAEATPQLLEEDTSEGTIKVNRRMLGPIDVFSQERASSYAAPPLSQDSQPSSIASAPAPSPTRLPSDDQPQLLRPEFTAQQQFIQES